MNDTNFFKQLGYRGMNGKFKHWEVAQMFIEKYRFKYDNDVLKIFCNGEWRVAYDVLNYLVIELDITTTQAERDEVMYTIKTLLLQPYDIKEVH